MALSVSVAAQEGQRETRIGEEGFKSPPATLDQMDWLVGQWEGKGIRGAPAMESWLKPMGGMMVGTFVQEDADGAIMFTEHMYLVEEAGTLALQLKHFNADLTGWEEKDDMVTFRLVAIEPCAAFFNALTLRCADKEKPGEGLVAAVRMQSGGEQVFWLRSQGVPSNPDNFFDCDEPASQLPRCLLNIKGWAEYVERSYLEDALSRDGATEVEKRTIRQNQSRALELRNKICSAEAGGASDEDLSSALRMRCSIRMIDQRTHEIWDKWLAEKAKAGLATPRPDPLSALTVPTVN